MNKSNSTVGKSSKILKAIPRTALDVAKNSSGVMADSAGKMVDSAGRMVDSAGKMAEKVKTAADHAMQPIKDATEKILHRNTKRTLNPHYANRQDHYNYDDLITCGKGELFGAGNPQLPLPNMLMFDRITKVNETGGIGSGEIIAELDIKKNLWFFDCHFKGDPVMPGCLGLDALWQLLGFYLGWMGGVGKGRAIGLSELKFTGEVLPTAQLVQYKVTITRLVLNRLIMGVGDGELSVDGKLVYQAKGLKVGLFTTI